MSERPYIVLEAVRITDTDQAVYQLVGTVEAAHDDRAAIVAATKGWPLERQAGEFVAVPARFWKPRERHVQHVVKDTWA